VAFVVLVQALGVEEVYMCDGCVCDFDSQVVCGFWGWVWHGFWCEVCQVLVVCCLLVGGLGRGGLWLRVL
jgi:hypothetical protein